MHAPDVKSPIQVIDRAVMLLDRIARGGPSGASLTALTTSTGLAASTGHTLLASLAAHGLVAQITGTRAYVLGPRFFELNRAFSLHHDLGAIASPVMRELWAETNETVHLAVLQAGARVDIAVLVSPQLLNINPLAGLKAASSPDPMIHTAAGKVLLAGAPEADRNAILANLQDAALDTVESMLSRTRDDGFATNVEEEASGVCGIAAPVIDHEGTTIAALCVGYPAVRQTTAYQESMRVATVRAAAALSRMLGGSTDA
ncbi:IclR family transcriptional regulator [Microbacterium dauci]|uniref:IclR family transcriptional regulator n=1 Tax=Microbacterium dauci TaxID=3048008 RepID=A0ABT6ZE80_9MICO|nr:IclR family transcriptional regulator [Microbacterium sp. LX3-4]MDJ1114474.1 IclR family transcriptional regulator [Microbacterium sp. LX3-4]